VVGCRPRRISRTWVIIIGHTNGIMKAWQQGLAHATSRVNAILER
jgi:hypothetical protein